MKTEQFLKENGIEMTGFVSSSTYDAVVRVVDKLRQPPVSGELPALDIKEGDYVEGSWRDPATQKTWPGGGTVRRFPAGLFVQEGEDGGITPLEYFFHFRYIIKEVPRNGT